MSRAGSIIKRTLVSFYDDQMTHHAAALTYYSLMSLFPAVLLALSLLGLVGQYPETYDAILGYLRDVAPASVLDAARQLAAHGAAEQGHGGDRRSRSASSLALYGTTGVLEAARRALNVVFEVESGRSFLRRKPIDVASTVVLMALDPRQPGPGLRRRRLRRRPAGLHRARRDRRARSGTSPAGRRRSLVAMLVFSYIYYVTPDVQHRSFRWVTPGAVVGVLLWLLASFGLLDLPLAGSPTSARSTARSPARSCSSPGSG